MRRPLLAPLAVVLLFACGPESTLELSGSEPDVEPMEASQALATSSAACLPQAPTPFAVLRNAFIPKSDDAAYPYFPATGYLAGERSMGQFATSQATGDKYFFQWVNRCNDGPVGGACDRTNKGNLPALTVGVHEYRFFFTTLAKANACTVAQLHQALGLPTASVLKGKGVKSYTSGPIASLLTQGRMVDVCWLFAEPGLAAHLDGVALDYEPQDRRSPTTTTSLLTRLAGTLHARGKKALLWTNRVTSAGAARNGIDGSNGSALLDAFDLVPLFADDSIPAAGVRAELRRQQSVWGLEARQRGKLYVLTGLGAGDSAISLSALAAVHAHVLAERLAGVAVWNDGADFSRCTSPAFRQVECLVYGRGC